MYYAKVSPADSPIFKLVNVHFFGILKHSWFLHKTTLCLTLVPVWRVLGGVCQS